MAPDASSPYASHVNSEYTQKNQQSSGLGAVLRAGDVLCFPGTPDALAHLGASGGFMGHVMLAASPPRCVPQGSSEAHFLRTCWPNAQVDTLWVVRTAECKRSAARGVHITKHMLFLDEFGEIYACGEEQADMLVRFETPCKVEVWQSPEFVRSNLNLDGMNRVLQEITSRDAQWSWSTAIKAFAISMITDSSPQHYSLDEMQSSWEADLICSSFVVVFWQMYICEICRSKAMDPTPWILKVMPLLADQTLPGKMLETMFECGWIRCARFSVGSSSPAPEALMKKTGSQDNMAAKQRYRANTENVAPAGTALNQRSRANSMPW